MGGCQGKQGADAPKPGSKGSSSVPKKEIKEGGIGHAQFIIENTGKITDYYQLDKKKLGEGSYGSVCKATNISTKAIRAVKTISKSQMKNLERFKQEIAIMKMMDHPNIIKLFESFEDHRTGPWASNLPHGPISRTGAPRSWNIYLVMELCSGGELFDRIIESGHFSEVQAAILMQQIIRQGLGACAPQVLAGNYDQLSDLWSCGVIMYVLLCGYPPFFGDTDSEVLAKVRLGNFNFNPADWKNVSEDAKTLIRHLLKMNPKDRYTAEQALNHEWIKNKAGESSWRSDAVPMPVATKHRSPEEAALHIIAGQLNEDQIKAILMVSLMTRQDVDADGSGVIDYTEFLAATLDRPRHDQNGDGKISQDELKMVLNNDEVEESLGHGMIIDLLKEVDGNGDGVIDFQDAADVAAIVHTHGVAQTRCTCEQQMFALF
eukprot:Skav234425  [mRNA]  locus=scaffold1656:141812:156149:- [translate_table: standard]